MSLWSIISNSSQSSSPYLVPTSNGTLATPESQGAGNSTDTTPATDSVNISSTAQAAAAASSDNQEDFTRLSQDVRSTLDAQYKAAKAAGKPSLPDLSGMSGRALAAIVLNKAGKFSTAEQQDAKAALDQQTRDAFAQATAGGMSMTMLASYSGTLVQQYDAMSPEERQARGWTEQFRDNAAKVVSEGSLSLFDRLDG